MSGYIQLKRDFFNHPIWLKPRSFSQAEAYIDLLQSACYNDSQEILIGTTYLTLQRGEMAVSVRELASKWQWSRGKVETFLKMLKKHKEIAIKTQSGTLPSVLTLLKYNKLVNSPNNIKTENKTLLRHKQDTIKTPLNNIVKEQKNKRTKEHSPPTPSKGESETADKINYSNLLSLYPKRDAPIQCYHALAEAFELDPKLTEAFVAHRVKAIAAKLASWSKEQRRYIPNAKKFWEEQQWQNPPEYWEEKPTSTNNQTNARVNRNKGTANDRTRDYSDVPTLIKGRG